jgi:hypothetical protein
VGACQSGVKLGLGLSSVDRFRVGQSQEQEQVQVQVQDQAKDRAQEDGALQYRPRGRWDDLELSSDTAIMSSCQLTISSLSVCTVSRRDTTIGGMLVSRLVLYHWVGYGSIVHVHT